MLNRISRTKLALNWTLIFVWSLSSNLGHVAAACNATSCPSGQLCCGGSNPLATCLDPTIAICCTALNASWTCPLGSQCVASTQKCQVAVVLDAPPTAAALASAAAPSPAAAPAAASPDPAPAPASLAPSPPAAPSVQASIIPSPDPSPTTVAPSVPASPPAASPLSVPSASVGHSLSPSNAPRQSSSSALPPEAIAGIVIGSILATLVFCVIVGSVGRRIVERNRKNVIPAAPVYHTYNPPLGVDTSFSPRVTRATPPLTASTSLPRLSPPAMAPLSNSTEGIMYHSSISSPSASSLTVPVMSHPYATTIPSITATPYPAPLIHERSSNTPPILSPADAQNGYETMASPTISDPPNSMSPGVSYRTGGSRPLPQKPDVSSDPPTYQDTLQQLAKIHYSDPKNL
ncbi:hypothetical protein SeLEV6574_g07027 [Synchytrium endobioticum]|uniref:Uncharacterized protein n=1 Tax=Synchytrium endobioticum TaxID=286115 RepID=A0A507CJ17_9FUNG|nr:hypothetical protein SeLEV6574_g07027 [Synchytrium endobioticum]